MLYSRWRWCSPFYWVSRSSNSDRGFVKVTHVRWRQQLVINLMVMVLQLSWDADRMSSSVPTELVSHRDNDAMDRRTVLTSLMNSNVVSTVKCNNIKVKEWRISLQWLVGQFTRDKIEPTWGEIEPNIGKLIQFQNFQFCEFFKFSDVQSDLTCQSWVKSQLT